MATVPVVQPSAKIKSIAGKAQVREIVNVVNSEMSFIPFL